MDIEGILIVLGLIALFVLLFVCWHCERENEKDRAKAEDDLPDRHFLIRVTRPDGEVHSEVKESAKHKPDVSATYGGVTYIWCGKYHAPVGWLLEVEEWTP